MPQHSGSSLGGQTGVPDHVVTGDRQEVNRTIEVIGLVELDLEVEGCAASHARRSRSTLVRSVPPR